MSISSMEGEQEDLLRSEFKDEDSHISKMGYSSSGKGFFKSLQKILRLSNTTKSGFHPLHERKQYSRRSHPWYVLIVITSLVIGLTIGLLTSNKVKMIFHTRPSIINLGSCGIIASDAQARGCVFDLVLGAWIQPECHDEELYAKYIPLLKGLNMSWFSDPVGLDEISFEDALTGEYLPVWTGGSHHHLHCSYFWERQWKAAKEARKAIDSETRSDEHTLHCIDHNGRPMVEEILSFQNALRVSSPVECLIG